jgi:alpha-ketoglutarate-dependent taurine dioxygenase
MSSVTSSMTVYNEILAAHPEYIPVYYNGFAFRSVEADGAPIEWRLPVFTYHNGLLSCAIRRMAIETARINRMPYTNLENAALEYLDKTAARADLRFDMKLERGDIQLINNFTTFHARTNFVDSDESALKRHLLRLWLQLPDGRSFLRVYPTIYDGVPKTISRH